MYSTRSASIKKELEMRKISCHTPLNLLSVPREWFKCSTNVWIFSFQRFLFGSLALFNQPFGNNAKLFAINQCFSIRVVGGCHKKRVDLKT